MLNLKREECFWNSQDENKFINIEMRESDPDGETTFD